MYYYENLQLTEITTCFRLSECQIDDILTATVDLLNNYLLCVSGETLAAKYENH